MIKIRPETPADYAAVYQIHKLAFDGRDAEPRLVEALRQEEGTISLVAEVDGLPVGHILFSQIQIVAGEGQPSRETSPARMIPAISLAPIAVLPGYQNQGIGAALVQRGLEECRNAGHKIAIVLGHSNYYPRFGFSVALAKPLVCPFGDCGEAWMALELEPGALAGITGTVKYPKAFDNV